MRKTILVTFIILIVSVITPFTISRAFVDNTIYETVYVKSGDSVWHIAEKYTTDGKDIREVIYEIRKINKLDNNASVYPGQTLKVPVNNKSM